MEMIQEGILELAMLLIVALIGYVTRKVTKFLDDKGLVAKLEANKELVKVAVNAVEQTYKHLGGSEKLNVAKMEVVKMMNERKIKISEKEIDNLIESAVKEMNDSIKKELQK